MPNRVLIGNRSTGGYGIYVSQNGENVLDTTNALQFDSRMGASLIVQSFGQGSIAANTNGNASVDFTHNLGYNPLFALRWNLSTHLSGGVATKVYTPSSAESIYVDQTGSGEDENEGDVAFGVSVAHASTNAIRIVNRYYFAGNFQTDPTRPTIYYAIVVFHEADFTGGKGL